MIRQLIHAPDYPGIEKTLFSLQSEINVTIEVGECRNRELLTVTDRVPAPENAAMRANLYRTTILPFLIAPELAYAEPRAYELYLRAWFALPEVRAGGEKDVELAFALLLAFPELGPRMIYAAAARDEPLDGERRLFGWYQITDLPLVPTPRSLTSLLGGIRRRPLPAGVALVEEMGIVRRVRGIYRVLLSRRLRHPVDPCPSGIPVQPVRGPELLHGRIRPIPVITGQSVVHQ